MDEKLPHRLTIYPNAIFQPRPLRTKKKVDFCAPGSRSLIAQKPLSRPATTSANFVTKVGETERLRDLPIAASTNTGDKIFCARFHVSLSPHRDCQRRFARHLLLPAFRSTPSGFHGRHRIRNLVHFASPLACFFAAEHLASAPRMSQQCRQVCCTGYFHRLVEPETRRRQEMGPAARRQVQKFSHLGAAIESKSSQSAYDLAYPHDATADAAQAETEYHWSDIQCQLDGAASAFWYKLTPKFKYVRRYITAKAQAPALDKPAYYDPKPRNLSEPLVQGWQTLS